MHPHVHYQVLTAIACATLWKPVWRFGWRFRSLSTRKKFALNQRKGCAVRGERGIGSGSVHNHHRRHHGDGTYTTPQGLRFQPPGLNVYIPGKLIANNMPRTQAGILHLVGAKKEVVVLLKSSFPHSGSTITEDASLAEGSIFFPEIFSSLKQPRKQLSQQKGYNNLLQLQMVSRFEKSTTGKASFGKKDFVLDFVLHVSFHYVLAVHKRAHFPSIEFVQCPNASVITEKRAHFKSQQKAINQFCELLREILPHYAWAKGNSLKIPHIDNYTALPHICTLRDQDTGCNTARPTVTGS